MCTSTTRLTHLLALTCLTWLGPALGCSAASSNDLAGSYGGPGGPAAPPDDDDFGSSSSGGGGDDQCAVYTETAENQLQPSDIIIAIDQSGSMNTETGWVKDQLNGFAAQIMASGIDVRVVVIAGKPGSENGFCVPAPLGSGNCPDDGNPPALLHVDQHVDSHDALARILQTYDLYKQVLRPEASKHIVVISDDDSDMDALTFDTIVKAEDPSFADYTFHAIVSGDDNCPFAAEEGKVYKQLVGWTQGVFGDLCLQSFAPVWDELSTQVASNATLACEWVIPEPPVGEVFDPDRVNVDVTLDGTQTALGYVTAPQDCGAVTGGWFYDDPQNPTVISVCPETCTVMHGADSAELRIALGCATVPAPPK